MNGSGRSARPPISIGMPVYNGAATLGAALDCLLGQTWGDFELLISDNASTDATEAICRARAARDPRIRYRRQPRNLGATANFAHVLAEARGEYFMWAAADDVRSSDFLAANRTFLAAHPDFAGSTSPVRFAGGPFHPRAMGDAALTDDDPFERLAQFFCGWHANARFYALFRRAAISGWAQMHQTFLGADWTLVTHAAMQGKLARLDGGWVELGARGMSRRTNLFAPLRHRAIDWLLPFNRLARDTRATMAGASPLQRARIHAALASLNAQAFVMQFLAMRRQPQVASNVR